MGTPYYISGNALYSALARRLSEETKRHLQVSAGMFVPGEHGGFPDAHSQSGGVSFFGTGLRPVERYDDLFVFRDMAQRWLSDTRPRDAHNTHPLQEFSTTAGYAPTRSSAGHPRNASRSARCRGTSTATSILTNPLARRRSRSPRACSMACVSVARETMASG